MSVQSMGIHGMGMRGAAMKVAWRFMFLLMASLPVFAGDLTKLEIVVKNDVNKPVANASVVVKFVQGRSIVKLGKNIRKSWELRTGEQGSVKIPAIPQGKILIQVIAKNYQTFGEVFDVNEDERTIDIKLNLPQPQYSAH